MATSDSDTSAATFSKDFVEELALIRVRESQFSKTGWTLGVIHVLSVAVAGAYFINATLLIEVGAYDELLFSRFTATSFIFVSLIAMIVAVLLHFRADKLRNVLILYPLFCKADSAPLRLQLGSDLAQILLDSGNSKRLAYLKGLEDGKKEALEYKYEGASSNKSDQK